jgi:hypothetical protein
LRVCSVFSYHRSSSDYLQAGLGYLSQPCTIAHAKRAYTQMAACWSSMYQHAMFQDVSVCGYRIEITCRFVGSPDGGECSIDDCIRSVAWLLEDATTCFRAVAPPTALLRWKLLSVHPLYQRINDSFILAEMEFNRICRGSNERPPPVAAVQYLTKLLNDTGMNYGPA